LYRENGVITSPNFNLILDASYPSYSKCVWTIHTKKNNYISLNFQYFDVLGKNDGIACSKDYVLVKDGAAENSPTLGKVLLYK